MTDPPRHAAECRRYEAERHDGRSPAFRAAERDLIGVIRRIGAVHCDGIAYSFDAGAASIRRLEVYKPAKGGRPKAEEFTPHRVYKNPVT
jgi:hypothetical protein